MSEQHTPIHFEFCPVQMIPMRDLELDPRFNREVNERTIKQIDADPDPDKFGVIQAARLNGNGKYTIYDGGHRYSWLQHIGYDGDVPVAVARMTDPHVLAVKFVDMNTQRIPVNPWERYRKLLYAGDPMYVAIDRDVTAVGWRVGPKAIEGIVAPPPLVRLYKAEPEHAVRETLALARDLWDGRFKSTDGQLLLGLWGVISGLGNQLDRQAFIDRLDTHEPSDLLARARERRARERGTIAKNVERELLRAYRARRREPVSA
jgi:hypothetical protein